MVVCRIFPKLPVSQAFGIGVTNVGKTLILRLLSFVAVFSGTLVVGQIVPVVVKAEAQSTLPLANDPANPSNSHTGRSTTTDDDDSNY